LEECLDRCVSVFFFFQAEDGIRDFHVTGVQTCALPISEQRQPEQRRQAWLLPSSEPERQQRPHPKSGRAERSLQPCRLPWPRFRSEERRVGKEYRSRV